MTPGRVVVFEGADASGKTTLAKALRPDVILHGTPFIGWVEEAHWAMLAAATKYWGEGKLVAIDRHWLSEYVYGRIIRGSVGYTDAVAHKFDQMIRDYGFYVLCVPSNRAKHIARFEAEKGRGEYPDRIDLIAEQYARIGHGYALQEGDDYFDRYVRHGDFLEGPAMLYDIDTDGRDFFKFAERIKERIS